MQYNGPIQNEVKSRRMLYDFEFMWFLKDPALVYKAQYKLHRKVIELYPNKVVRTAYLWWFIPLAQTAVVYNQYKK